MSLIDDIRANTSNVRLAKLAMAQAIENKGSSVGSYTNVPTFSNIIKGINSIETGLKVNGTEDAIILAANALVKGDVCSLVSPSGDLEAIETSLLPTTYKSGDTIKNLTLDGTRRIVSLDNGKLLLLPSGKGLVPFYLVDGEYKQMTQNGEYSILYGWNMFNTETYMTYAYDPVEKILFLPNIYVSSSSSSRRSYCTVDIENLNISKAVTTMPTGAYGQTIYAKNSHVIVNCANISTSTKVTSVAVRSMVSKFTSSSNTYSNTVITKYSSGTFDHICDLNGDLMLGQIMCVCQTDCNGSTEVYLAKLVYENDTYNVAGYSSLIPNAKTSSNNYLTGFGGDTYAQISASGERLYYLDTANTLHQVIVNTSTMALEEASLFFDDGLDATKIDAFVLVKGDGFLYVKSTDTESYEEDELVRLYYYDTGIGGFRFMGCPAKVFNTVAMSGVLPVQPHFLSGKNTIIQSSTGLMTLYNVGFLKNDYDYVATNCNNTMLSDESVNAYGVVKDNILEGELGEASVFLKT